MIRVLMVIAVAMGVRADAQETIWFAPIRLTAAQSNWYPRPIQKQVGKLLHLDNERFKFLVEGDEVATTGAAYRVIWVRPKNVSEKQSEALQLFKDKKYREAVKPLIDSIAERPPIWRQQWLSMLASYAAFQSGRNEIALELVSQLDARPLAPSVLAWLPVDWTGRRPVAARVSAALEKLDDQSPAVRLVAASWLIQSTERKAATAVLDRLSVSTDRPFIAQLAEALKWRFADPPTVRQQHADWQKKLDRIPMTLQTGPTQVLVQKLRAASMPSKATKLELSLILTPVIPIADQVFESIPRSGF